ncbi:MAG: hypothetical protein ABIH23_08210 [bacterium]
MDFWGRKSEWVAVTPDDPREQIQLGVIELAKVSGISIIPCLYTLSRKIVLNKWDRIIVPLPFCCISMGYREPLPIPADSSREEKETPHRQLEQENHQDIRRSEDLAQDRNC